MSFPLQEVVVKISKKKIMKSAKKVVGSFGKDLRNSPLGRASRGKRTRGFF